MPNTLKPFLFVGPTLTALEHQVISIPESLSVLPPVRRGDIADLMTSHEDSGTLILVDGVFHQSLSVGHAELNDAIQAGWQIWGLSSMGAIRAYEMREFGVHGFGKVYQKFLDEDDFQDDEVALLHEAVFPYKAFSEPLVHLRCALEALVQANLISAYDADETVALLKSRWYGDRTLRFFGTLVMSKAPEEHRAEITAFLSDFDPFRIKAWDLVEFLDQQPWLCG